MGLVNRVVPADELEAYVKNYADTIAGNAPLTVKAAKFIANETHARRKQARSRALRRNWSSTASRAATTPRAAAPSWRSASRPSRGREWNSVARAGGSLVPREGARQRMIPLGRSALAQAVAEGARGLAVQ